ncbi:MAG: PQQ-binding-like beta-propeller repeat protein, partial [Proteobacteria bacterium]|nr:PQQ-binding-like beta-propeller repeat protein [Pseudomonadota bacterium]
DARTGGLRWYHQRKANDALDHDLGAAPTLFRSPELKDVLAFGGKDGWVVALDRMTRKQIFQTAITTIEGRNATPTEQGVRVCPGAYGGIEWNGLAYDLTRNALLAGSVDWCTTIKKGKAKYIAGEFFFGGDYQMDPEEKATGWVTSVDASVGTIKWKFHTDKPVVSGITPTAGGIVIFGDTGGTLFALDSADGKPLYRLPTAGMIAGGVITYAINNKQYIAFTSGNVSRMTFGNLGDPSIIVLALPN